MATVYIGIGSNIGDRRANCMNAVKSMNESGIVVTKESSLYETEPWGMKEQPLFINMAVIAETDLSPESALAALKCIEKEMGREEASRWGPRCIDLDILFYDDRIITEKDLCIPHPLLQQREFVLLPLSEIAPDKWHPVLKKTVRRLREELCDV
ncbi:MAG TPA: 2-amino-4-hydroxy-6-hydroxymethyldihydropteridine diphosphokinase [Dissulfurispiraceae bacterium]|nr:2-amino-4-hydroxy-6-hydroxymethyldihydropteridine diphosphokinase [Dissulfurispiraceae bacterium]